MATFKPATRRRAKARIGLTGPSGSGKTLGALFLAAGLGGKTAVIDTEHCSASLYAGHDGVPAFDVLELEPPFTPERFIAAMREAAAAGYETLVIDSITHEWNGAGGCLELVDQIAAAKYRGNTWSAFSEITPRHRALLDAILRFPGHVIVTMRSKTETAQEESNGRKKVVKLGMKAEQRDGFEYELTTVLDITHSGHFALASKDRTGLFTDTDPAPLTPETGAMLRAWLDSGAEPAPQAEPAKAGAMDPEALEDYKRAISGARTERELRAVFTTAFRAAEAARDVDAIADLTAAKDARKVVLGASTGPVIEAPPPGPDMTPPGEDSVSYLEGVAE